MLPFPDGYDTWLEIGLDFRGFVAVVEDAYVHTLAAVKKQSRFVQNNLNEKIDVYIVFPIPVSRHMENRS